jgi:hypothetical protein
MRSSPYILFTRSLLALLLCIFSSNLYAQQLPPKPFAIFTNPSQSLMFGAFCQGSLGGSVIIFPDGTRSATGDIITLGLGYPFAAAIIDVEAPLGTRIAVLNGPNATLTGTNGGSMTMLIGNTDLDANFVTTVSPPGRTQVRVGGTLIVGSPLANPKGYYSGLFIITFVQE